jgi:glycosyltransferase involved in cell wall biosynthesis
MFDLVFVSLEDWDDIWRRNQFLCSGLAKRFPENKILFIGRPRLAHHAVRSGGLGELHKSATWAVPGHTNIRVARSLKLVPNSLPGGRQFNDAMARSYIQRVMKEVGIREHLLWLNPHDAVHMAGRMGEQAVIYDITDDWALASGSPQEKQLIQEQDHLLCKKADLVVVCSQALEHSRKSLAKRILLLPNGVNVEHYQSVSQAQKAGAWPSPVFGYTGTLHSDRVDVNLIAAIAAAFPQGSVVLVGPGKLQNEDLQLLSKYNNVHFTGAVPYAQIPKNMAEFDVCIVPHVESEFTESLNPIKLWEYLASGKPIVTSNVAGFREYSELCHIASGASEFVAACQAALQEDASRAELRMAEAAKHSWDTRIDCLLSVLEDVVGQGKQKAVT